MAQYIDRDKAIDGACEALRGAIRCGKAQFAAARWVVDELEIIPAADVVPVVRGHWHVIKTNCAGMIVTSYQCTVCGKTCATQMRIFHDDDVPMCCCWCGARMDEEAPNGGDTD